MPHPLCSGIGRPRAIRAEERKETIQRVTPPLSVLPRLGLSYVHEVEA